MKLYNTLTRKKEDFTTIEPNKVKMYACGPTVYSYIHIGNARPMIVFDTLRRYFEYKGMDVTFVQNYTDVDDRIINQSIKENIPFNEISEKYITECKIDEKNLNIKEHSFKPKVTEEMNEIIAMISLLEEKGFTYQKNGTVYFDTEKFKEYGKLSKKNLDELESGARVATDSEKNNLSDFVLWKPAKQGEPLWESPWGKGRPGWHIECSAMIKKYLGNTIDIHAGGEDLVFPHHENEIAQSEAANDAPLANFWLHNGFINVDNKKMSKSLGNFFTIGEIAEKYPHDIIRFFILLGHYRMPINFSEELMQAAENSLNRIKNCAENLQYTSTITVNKELSEKEQALAKESKKFTEDFETSMDNDLNTADGITAIFELVKFINLNISEESSIKFIANLSETLKKLTNILGLEVFKDKELNGEIETLIAKRQEARKNKDFKKADEIRDKLKEMGITLEDTSKGVKWSYNK